MIASPARLLPRPLTARRGLLSFACALAALLAAAPARAEGITATVDRTDTSVEEPVVLTVQVDGSQSAEPTLPDLSDFEVHRQGKASQVQIINGHLSTGATYTYVMAPRRAGRFTVGAVSVSLGGKTCRSDPFAITVHPAAAPPAGVPGTAGGAAPAARPTESGRAAGLFIAAEVTPPRVVAGEQAIYTWRFFRRQRVGNAQVSLPSFEGLLTEPLGEQREYDTHLEGIAYHVVEIRRALFAEEPGTITIGASSLQCEVFPEGRGGAAGAFPGPFDALFGHGPRQTRTLRSPPLSLVVDPLPPPPRGFSGLVGQFHAEATLSPTEVGVGDSATYTVVLRGSGNLQHMGEVSFAEVPGLKAYDDRPVLDRDARGAQLAATKTYRRALVPVAAGNLVVPPTTFTYFDPATRAYATAATEALTLVVRPHGAGSGAAVPPAGSGAGASPATPTPIRGVVTPDKVPVAILADDILPNYDAPDALLAQRIGRARVLVWLGSLGAPWALYAAVALWQHQRRAGRSGSRRRGVRREAERAARALTPLLRAGRVPEAATAASRALRAYLGARLEVEGGAMTATEARTRLLARGCDDALAGRAENFLRRCEGAQYSFAPGTVSLYTSLGEELRTLLAQLDRKLKR